MRVHAVVCGDGEGGFSDRWRSNSRRSLTLDPQPKTSSTILNPTPVAVVCQKEITAEVRRHHSCAQFSLTDL